MPIKYVDFGKSKNVCKDFDDKYGLYDYAKDIIWVHSRLPEYTLPSKRSVLLHEKGHQKLNKAEVLKYFTPEQEEAFCDLWCIVSLKRQDNTDFGIIVRDRIMKGTIWRDFKSRPGIIKRMLKEIGIPAKIALINALL